MHRPRRRPQGAVALQVAPKDKGARLACGARRLEGQDAVLQSLAAEEGVGVGLKPRRPDDAFVLHHAQMRKRIEEAQVTLGNRNHAHRTFRQVWAGRRICKALCNQAQTTGTVGDKRRHLNLLAQRIHHRIGNLEQPTIDGAATHMRRLSVQNRGLSPEYARPANRKRL